MAGLLPSSHPNLFSVDLKILRHSSPSFPTTITVPLSSSSGWIPSRVLRFRCPEAGKARRIRIDRSPSGDDEEPCPPSRVIPDEWGERSEPEVEPPAEADTPMDEDEWGREVIPGEATTVADEWGEKAEPEEPEEPSKPDPPVLEDEWGNSIPAVDDKLGDLKRCLVDTVYGTELGLRASADVRAEILELVNQLEAHNPTSAPNNAPELLDGNWILV
ncbi:putative plastid-lipid-associated protein 3, chloroplastic [Apostasia shenzhenica]|uniref:Putative plastid-lipid-associated protein 3, chloroplastic n=1 Tax=Apostasia shenzhenica TaxID=1088818 RepID=A0A2I0ATI3_9ASPA|nr:putative plastid-lipid-associated protein 3, chloroplastic [Apostasia shenzhenica]